MNVQNGGQAELRSCPQAEPPPGLHSFLGKADWHLSTGDCKVCFYTMGWGGNGLSHGSLKPTAATPSSTHTVTGKGASSVPDRTVWTE